MIVEEVVRTNRKKEKEPNSTMILKESRGVNISSSQVSYSVTYTFLNERVERPRAIIVILVLTEAVVFIVLCSNICDFKGKVEDRCAVIQSHKVPEPGVDVVDNQRGTDDTSPDEKKKKRAVETRGVGQAGGRRVEKERDDRFAEVSPQSFFENSPDKVRDKAVDNSQVSNPAVDFDESQLLR